MDQLGVGFLNGFGLPPVEFVELTAELGCRHMSTAVHGLPMLPLDYPRYSLKDAALRRDVLAAMGHHGVRISLGDGFLVLPGTESPSWAGDLDALAEDAMKQTRLLINNPREMTQAAALGIYRAAL